MSLCTNYYNLAVYSTYAGTTPYYIKGQHDSLTKKKVMASRDGNYFGPNTIFFDFKENLAIGTYYIDQEEGYDSLSNRSDIYRRRLHPETRSSKCTERLKYKVQRLNDHNEFLVEKVFRQDYTDVLCHYGKVEMPICECGKRMTPALIDLGDGCSFNLETAMDMNIMTPKDNSEESFLLVTNKETSLIIRGEGEMLLVKGEVRP